MGQKTLFCQIDDAAGEIDRMFLDISRKIQIEFEGKLGHLSENGYKIEIYGDVTSLLKIQEELKTRGIHSSIRRDPKKRKTK